MQSFNSQAVARQQLFQLITTHWRFRGSLSPMFADMNDQECCAAGRIEKALDQKMKKRGLSSQWHVFFKLSTCLMLVWFF